MQPISDRTLLIGNITLGILIIFCLFSKGNVAVDRPVSLHLASKQNTVGIRKLTGLKPYSHTNIIPVVDERFLEEREALKNRESERQLESERKLL